MAHPPFTHSPGIVPPARPVVQHSAPAPVATFAALSGLASRAALVTTSIRDIGPSPQAGINSGQGNQGSSNTAHLAGHAGTAANRIALPRQLHVGTTPQTVMTS